MTTRLSKAFSRPSRASWLTTSSIKPEWKRRPLSTPGLSCSTTASGVTPLWVIEALLNTRGMYAKNKTARPRNGGRFTTGYCLLATDYSHPSAQHLRHSDFVIDSNFGFRISSFAPPPACKGAEVADNVEADRQEARHTHAHGGAFMATRPILLSAIFTA